MNTIDPKKYVSIVYCVAGLAVDAALEMAGIPHTARQKFLLSPKWRETLREIIKKQMKGERKTK